MWTRHIRGSQNGIAVNRLQKNIQGLRHCVPIGKEEEDEAYD
jgi:hypothetical protein